MARRLVLASLLMAIPGPAAWAQFARAARVPLVPAAAAPLAAARPRVFATPGEALALAVQSESARLEAAASAPASASRSASEALPAAERAAFSAAGLAREGASSESDRERADFVDAARRDEPSFADPSASAGAGVPASRLNPSEGRGRAPSAPVPAPRSAARALIAGGFLSQLAGGIASVAAPLLLLALTGSAATVGFVVAAGAALDAAGVLAGGRLADRAGSSRALAAAGWARAAALAALPAVALLGGGVAVGGVIAAYLAESLARGAADSARSVLPSQLAGRDETQLNRMLYSNRAAFHAGGIAGPLLAGALIALSGGSTLAALALAPLGLAAAALVYSRLPRAEPAAAGAARAPSSRRDAWTLWAWVLSGLIALAPLKALLPAVFAAQVLMDPASAAWLAASFGAGGLVGALLYGRLSRLSLGVWLGLGAAGTAALAAAFAPGALLPAAVGIALFAALNEGARSALEAAIQLRSGPEGAGRAMSGARFTANLAGLSFRFLAGLAFAAALLPLHGFWIIGAGLGTVALAQLWASRRLTGPPAPPAAALPFQPVSWTPPAVRPPSSGLFDKDPAEDSPAIRANYMRAKKGPHFYFRNMLLPMQERFAQLMDMSAMPRVLLHGSPHVDNYSKTARGEGMTDFDRSRVGPYAWDLLRFMVSLSLRRKKPAEDLLAPKVLKKLRKGYLEGYRRPERPAPPSEQLEDAKAEAHERSVNAYLAAGGKWAEELRADPLPVEHPGVAALVAEYARRRGGRLLERYRIEEAGRGKGSMGLRPIYLVVLAPLASDEDRVLLSFKASRTDPDTRWYKNPYGSETERARAAAELYAPGRDPWAGSAVLGGIEYDARAIPPFNAKIKSMLGEGKQADLAYVVGVQLGRSHRLSLKDAAPEALERHFDENFGDLVAAARTIRDEIALAHARYLERMKQGGMGAEKGDEE